jgi:hypothetical protein
MQERSNNIRHTMNSTTTQLLTSATVFHQSSYGLENLTSGYSVTRSIRRARMTSAFRLWTRYGLERLLAPAKPCLPSVSTSHYT